MKTYIHLVRLLAIGVGVHLGASEPLFEIEIPDAFSHDLQKLPIISRETLVKHGLDNAKAALGKEAELAISSNDLPILSRMLKSGNAIDRIQAAIAMGKLTAHMAEAQELLANFIAEETNPMRTEFGVDSINRHIAVTAAEESLVALSATPDSMPLPQETQRPHPLSEPMPVPQPPEPIKLPKSARTPVEEPALSRRWPVVVVVAAVVVAALGLLWLLLKKRK